MGAVPVLIALAAVGVDYGWQPDGTTSSRGDNVEYIIQIPPQQLQQVSSAGEITSTIDPSIQGRVSRIVVRVGTAPLPKDGGKVAPAADAAHSAALAEALTKADADAAVPIPEIASPLAASSLSGRAAGGSQALMKPDPDPQSGGYVFPESSGTTARTNPAVSTDPVTPGRDTRWGDSGGAAGSAATPAQGSAAPLADSNTRSSTAPGNAVANGSPQQSWANASTTSSPPAGGASSATTAGNRPTDPSDPNWSGYGTTPNFGTLPPGMSPPSGIVRPPASHTAAATENPDPQRTAAVSQPTTTAAQGPAATAGNPGLSRDAAGNLIDQLGRTVNALGQVIDPETGYLVDATGNLIDEFGRQIDRLGRLLPARDGAASLQPGGSARLQPPLAAGSFTQQPGSSFTQQAGQMPVTQQPGQMPVTQQPGQTPLYGQTPQTQQLGQTMPHYGASTAYPQQQAYTTGNNGYGQGAPLANTAQATPYAQPSTLRDPRQGQYAGSRPGGFYEEDNFRSPSDSRSPDSRPSDDRNSGPARLSSQDRDAPATAPAGAAALRPRTVAAQPFFLFLLLISVIGNAYLIYETGNLRRKFRNMVANVRAAKLTAPSAN